MSVAYDELYLKQFEKAVAAVFMHMTEICCNVEDTLNAFLGSTVFKDIHDRANPMYLNKSPRQLFECLTFDEEFDVEATYPDTSKDYDRDILYWTAIVLVRFQWYYNIDFSDWLNYFSFQDVYNKFYPAHEASYQYTVELLKDEYDSVIMSNNK